jgi:hypothetical protein
MTLAQRGDLILDFAFDRKTAGLTPGKDCLPVTHHVELTAAALGERGGFAELALERGGQTGRAGSIPSSFAVKNFDLHRAYRLMPALLAIGQIDEHRRRDH